MDDVARVPEDHWVEVILNLFDKEDATFETDSLYEELGPPSE